MILQVKNMVSYRLNLMVKSELEKLGLHCLKIELGEVEIVEDLPVEIMNQLILNIKKIGLSLIYDKKEKLSEKIKNIVIDVLYFSEKPLKINFSDHLSERLKYDYTYLANIFSETQGITIEHFYLNNKIERVKELLVYDELNISEIANKMHYSSIAHLSNQFKKMTGLTPSHYKHLKEKKRYPIEKV